MPPGNLPSAQFGGQPTGPIASQDLISSPSSPPATFMPAPASSSATINTSTIVAAGGVATIGVAAALIIIFAGRSAKQTGTNAGAQGSKKRGASAAVPAIAPSPSTRPARLASEAPGRTLNSSAALSAKDLSPQIAAEFETERRQLTQFHALSSGERQALLKQSIAVPELGSGRDAKVFAIPGYSGLVMRVPHATRNEAGESIFVPIDYSKHRALEMDRNLGLPLTLGVPAESPTAREYLQNRKRIPFEEASQMPGRRKLFQDKASVPIAILRNCTGSTPNDAHKYSYGLLRGKDEALKRLQQKFTDRKDAALPQIGKDAAFFASLDDYAIEKGIANYSQMTMENLYRDLGSSTSKRKFLAECKAGTFVCRPEDGYFENSAYAPEAQQNFYRRYERFSADYRSGIASTAAKPQEFFDKLAASAKNLTDAKIAVDYQHCGNIAINHQDGAVKWFDLGAAGEAAEQVTRSRADDVNSLASVLLGVETFGQAWDLIATIPDNAEVRAHIKTVSEKLEIGFKKHGIWKPGTQIAIGR